VWCGKNTYMLVDSPLREFHLRHIVRTEAMLPKLSGILPAVRDASRVRLLLSLSVLNCPHL
jgi:hypothetical protein